MNEQRLGSYGLQLAAEINLRRKEEPQRPLIFIAHDVGGLIVQQALLISNEPADSRYEHLVPSNAGTIFFGTPRQGTTPKWFHNLCRLYKIRNRDVDCGNLTSRRHCSPAVVALQRQFADFLEKSEERSNRVFSFYEGSEFSLTLPLIVPLETNRPMAWPSESLPASFVDMARFDGPRNAGFARVMTLIHHWTGRAPPSRDDKVNPGQARPLNNRQPAHKEDVVDEVYHLHELANGEIPRTD